MPSYFTWVLPQLPRPVHEEPLQPHSTQAVPHFGRLAEQSPHTGYEPKGLMTAGSDTANTTSGRSSICSMTTQGDHSTTPSGVKNGRAATSTWLRSCHRRIAKEVVTVCFSFTLQEKLHLTHLSLHGETRCKDLFLHGSHTRKSSREQMSSQK